MSQAFCSLVLEGDAGLPEDDVGIAALRVQHRGLSGSGGEAFDRRLVVGDLVREATDA